MAKQQHRKQFVDQPVQRALVVMVIRQWLLFLAGTLLFLFCVQVCLGEPHASLSAHLQAMWRDYSLVLIPVVLLSPVFINDFIKLSNRFAGPMLRFRRELRQLASGQPARPLELRKQDFWRDAAQDFNQVLSMIDSLQRASQSTDTPTVSVSSVTHEEQHESSKS